MQFIPSGHTPIATPPGHGMAVLFLREELKQDDSDDNVFMYDLFLNGEVHAII
jgi:hypothetical protein